MDAAALIVPSAFTNKSLDDAEVLQWNAAAQAELRRLAKLSPPTDAALLAAIAALDGQDAFPDTWLAPDTQRLARVVLATVDATTDTVLAVLNTSVKPLFLANPHPQLALGTARALPRPAGGPHAAQDYYSEQRWKARPGVANTIAWCLRALPTSGFEPAWPQLVPPVMTLLDDFQAPSKRRGCLLAHLLTTRAPAILLTRTGVGSLLLSSFLQALSAGLHDAEHTAPLLRAAARGALAAIERTTAEGSAARFDALCEILGERIVGGVWVYTAREADAVEATLEVLPEVVAALGIGTVRYLKALIPQCLHCLSIPEFGPAPARSFQTAALRALLAVMRACTPRVRVWRGAIVAGVGTFWVKRCDDDAGLRTDDDAELYTLVREVFAELAKACPSVLEEEYPKMLRAEPGALQAVLVK